MKYLIKEKNSILQQYGYKWDTFATTNSIEGWQKIYHHDMYDLWVMICPFQEKIYFYDEYDCGGMIWEDEEDIPYDMCIESKEFIEWLDDLIDSKIGE